MTVLDEICARIIRMYEGGMKGTNIIGIVGEPTRIVQTKEGGTYKGNPSTERPKKLSESDLRRIQLFSRTHHQSLLQDITNDCPMEVSTRLVRHALHNHNIFSRIVAKNLS
jgi:transposase